jgi:hypothetical protein
VGQGKEAKTVRQVALVVVLVAAAFAGGALLNGPGLLRAQARLLHFLGWNESDIASIELKGTVSNDPSMGSTPPSKPQAELMEGPVAPVPSVIAEPQFSRRAVSEAPGKHPQAGTVANVIVPSRTSTAPLASPPSASPNRTRLKTADYTLPLEDPGIKPANTTQQLLTRAASSSRAAPPSTILDTLVGLVPAATQTGEATQSSVVTVRSQADGRDDWAVLVQKMKALGVSRFVIEGEATDHVVFACLIPVAGRQAITQRFEAEGASPLEAARATLRRITLWRASQAVWPSTPHAD